MQKKNIAKCQKLKKTEKNGDKITNATVELVMKFTSNKDST